MELSIELIGNRDEFRSAMRKHLENHFQRLYEY